MYEEPLIISLIPVFIALFVNTNLLVAIYMNFYVWKTRDRNYLPVEFGGIDTFMTRAIRDGKFYPPTSRKRSEKEIAQFNEYKHFKSFRNTGIFLLFFEIFWFVGLIDSIIELFN